MPLVKQIPLVLVYSRLVIGALLLGLGVLQGPHFAPLAVGLLAVGVLTDVLDGVLARHLGVSTEKLRRLDSAVDQVFWALVLGATYLAWPGFFARHAAPLWLLVLLEALTYAVSYLRFGKEVATHSWGAKAWVLVSLAALIQIITTGDAHWLFLASFGMGVASRLEIVVIVLLLRQWTNDVPTAHHAWRLRHGKPIRRYKLLNG